MISEIDKLKHFHVENYSDTNFTDDLNDDKELKLAGYGNGEGGPNDWMYQQVIEAIVFENGGFVGNLGLSKKLWKKYIEASYKYRTNTNKMTASDYTHLFGYLNPYYRSAYNVPKRRK